MSLLTGLLFSIVPAVQASRASLNDALRQGGRGGIGGRRATTRDAPESARFRVAVDSLGTIRYAFLEQSSGDAALDEEARQYLALCRFQNPLTKSPMTGGLIWTSATFVFGNDLQLPPGPTERAP